MLLSLLNENPIFLITRIVSVLTAITIHEFSHGLIADKLGDPTPRANDRLTLNPIKHLDPFGTLALFFIGVGWAKPVPVDPFNFQDKKRDLAIVSLAGPASNLISAIIVALGLRILPYLGLPITTLFTIHTIAFTFIAISVGLAVFNLLPIPPLDGSKILFSLLPNHIAYEWEELLQRYGFIILLLLLFPFFGQGSLVMKIISPIISFILSLIL